MKQTQNRGCNTPNDVRKEKKGALKVTQTKSYVLLLFVFAFFLFQKAGAQTSTSLEYKVKAAYLLNFTRYVEWPVSAFPKPDSPIIIGVLGADPMGEALDKTVAGRTSHGRKVEVRRYQQSAQAMECHLVFISRTEGRQEEFLRALSGKPILTVGESSQFLASGGIINFVIVKDTVRFEINRNAVERAGLKISSRLLSLAHAIYP